MTTDFLDADDDDGLEGNLGALKQKFKQSQRRGPRSGAGNKRKPAGSYVMGGKRRRSGLYKDRGSDEDNSEDSEQEDSEEEEGDPGEMDGFIVQGDEDEDEASDEEEAVSSDESEEEKPKKGKGKKKPSRKARLVEEDSDDD